jgi:hypothetical protein
VVSDLDPDEDIHEPLTTKEGWKRFVDTEPVPPEPADLTDAAAYEDARLGYHARLAVVRTPTVSEVINVGKRLTLLNRHQVSARRGVIITGTAGTGKTTAITQLGKAHELRVRARYPHTDRLPVVFVTVPPAATARMLAVEFARFLGLPITGRPNQADITNAVCDLLSELRTDVVIVDEIHNLNLATRAGAEVSDQLKYLSERLPATFVYAGIDVAGTGLFTGVRGRQIASRFATIGTAPFPYGTQAQRENWQALVATLESTLRLDRHREGNLVKLDTYLYERTKGMIGSLSHLVRGAAIDAILDGTERITKAGLDEIHLDHTATEDHTRPGRRRRAG